MTVYTSIVTSATTIFDFDTESTNLYVATTGGLIGTAGVDVVVGTENNTSVVVNGEIGSSGANCIDLKGEVNQISVGTTGVVSSNTTAIYLEGNDNHVTNAGLISGAWGVIHYGGDISVNNSGTIMGHGESNYYWDAALYLLDDIDDGIEATINISNTGDLIGADTGIYTGEYYGYTSKTILQNSGTITGWLYASVVLGAGDDEVYNSGLMVGDLLLGGDNDTYDGRGGSVTGSVRGESGDDLYIIDDATISIVEDAAEGTDTVQSEVGFTLGDNFENLTLIGDGNVDGYGNGESNTITGNQGNNVLNGLGSADTLYGGAGDDKVNGGNGIDNLFGGDGDDKLRGQKGADIMKSEAGDDRLYGGEGNDNLFGGDGNDILKGGMGRDKLYGGDDADVFLFTKAAHSKNDVTADKIQDFELGLDTIDLSGVAAGTLTFIGGGAFSGTQGEVQVTGATNSTVLVDVDGDGIADMKISVIGVTGLTEGDFVL
ncbi:MAG: calcium-binding protein [Rhodobacteraceae bacterium]|nr:calcium-binding protein [Paracoccaceae bacterium]